jgi:hypothetical protein
MSSAVSIVIIPKLKDYLETNRDVSLLEMKEYLFNHGIFVGMDRLVEVLKESKELREMINNKIGIK